MKTILAILAALPLAAFAQGPGPGGNQAGPSPSPSPGAPGQRPELVQKRIQLAVVLGLSEALDLDTPQALRIRDIISKYDDRRLAAYKQIAASHDVLRRAAQGEKVAPAEVDQALQRAFDARAQLQAINRETFQAITQNFTPEQKAKTALFFARFHHRMAAKMGGPWMHRGPGMMGPGMGPGRGMGPNGRGMGPGMGRGMGMGGPGMGMMMGPDEQPDMMAGACRNGDCPWMTDEGDDVE